MTREEKALLLAAAALLLRVGPPPAALNEADRQYLGELAGGSDWRAIADNMLVLIKRVAEGDA